MDNTSLGNTHGYAKERLECYIGYGYSESQHSHPVFTIHLNIEEKGSGSESGEGIWSITTEWTVWTVRGRSLVSSEGSTNCLECATENVRSSLFLSRHGARFRGRSRWSGDMTSESNFLAGLLKLSNLLCIFAGHDRLTEKERKIRYSDEKIQHWDQS